MKKIIPVIIILAVVLVTLAVILKQRQPLNDQSSTGNQNTINESTGNRELNIGNDVCAEFPKEFVSNALGKSIVKTTKNDSQTTHVCQYYVDDNNFVTLRLNGSSVENQKKGQIALGRTITTNDKIKMEHFVVMHEDGLINEVVLVINPNLFIAVDRTSTKAANETEIIDFAAKVSERIVQGENIIVNQPVVTNKAIVPLPQEEDIVRSFFNIIDEGRASDAVLMLNPNNISDDSIKQAWGVQFNAFESIKIDKIEPSNQADWSESKHIYRVSLNVKMKPEAANIQPIPNYGYDNGANIRWVEMEKVGNLWKINGIATGP